MCLESRGFYSMRKQIEHGDLQCQYRGNQKWAWRVKGDPQSRDFNRAAVPQHICQSGGATTRGYASVRGYRALGCTLGDPALRQDHEAQQLSEHTDWFRGGGEIAVCCAKGVHGVGVNTSALGRQSKAGGHGIRRIRQQSRSSWNAIAGRIVSAARVGSWCVAPLPQNENSPIRGSIGRLQQLAPWSGVAPAAHMPGQPAEIIGAGRNLAHRVWRPNSNGKPRGPPYPAQKERPSDQPLLSAFQARRPPCR